MSDKFKIEQQSDRDSSGNYLYIIYNQDKKIAILWHDFRADDWGIRLLKNDNIVTEFSPEDPLREIISFKPLRLTVKGDLLFRSIYIEN